MSGSAPDPQTDQVHQDPQTPPAPLACEGNDGDGGPCPAAVPWIWWRSPKWKADQGVPGNWRKPKPALCSDCRKAKDNPAPRAPELPLGGAPVVDMPPALTSRESGQVDAWELRQAADARRARLDAGGIPRRWWGYTFRRYEKQRRGESWGAFLERLERLEGSTLGITRWNAGVASELRRWTPGRRSLLITGPVGGGKTTLAAARAVDLAGDHDVGWLSETGLYEALRGRWRRTGSSGATLLTRAIKTSVLFLDDLGTVEDLRPWHRDVMEALIVGRYNDDRPLVITTNLQIDPEPGPDGRRPPGLADLYGERVASRLVEMLGRRRKTGIPGYLELCGIDWRTGQPHQGADLEPPPEPPDPNHDHKRRAAGDTD